ncbi:unnamed protein product [Hymenolepis diminuta]|nr:unnamed protein product [Hymenolepis diminuta]
MAQVDPEIEPPIMTSVAPDNTSPVASTLIQGTPQKTEVITDSTNTTEAETTTTLSTTTTPAATTVVATETAPTTTSPSSFVVASTLVVPLLSALVLGC